MTEPIDPGPLLMDAVVCIVAPDLVGRPTENPDRGPDRGFIAEMDQRKDWQGYAAWLVRASNNYKELFRALMDAKEALLLIQSPGIDEQLPNYARDKGHEAIKRAGAVLDTLIEGGA